MTTRHIDIATKKILHQYHAAIYRLLRIPLDWITPDHREFTLCGMDHCHPLCQKIIRHPLGKAACAAFSAAQVTKCRFTGQSLATECHAGLTDMHIPIFISGAYSGCLCVGQYLDHQPTAADLDRVLSQLDYLGLTRSELKQYYAETTMLSAERARGLEELLRMLAEYVCETEDKLLLLEDINRNTPTAAARQFMEANFKSRLTIERISRRVNLSVSRFSHLFRQQVGDSPLNYLNRFRCQKAGDLLRGTSLTIAEIAAAVGFTNQNHFARTFRKINACSPTAFRTSAPRPATATPASSRDF